MRLYYSILFFSSLCALSPSHGSTSTEDMDNSSRESPTCTTYEQQSHFESLPIDVFIEITEYLEPQSLLNLRLTSKEIRKKTYNKYYGQQAFRAYSIPMIQGYGVVKCLARFIYEQEQEYNQIRVDLARLPKTDQAVGAYLALNQRLSAIEKTFSKQRKILPTSYFF